MGYIENNKEQARIAADGSGQRPPGAVAEPVFRAECIQCLECKDVCPRQALLADAMGYPYLADPERCTSCGLCADICMHSAIRLTEATRAGLEALLAIDDKTGVL